MMGPSRILMAIAPSPLTLSFSSRPPVVPISFLSTITARPTSISLSSSARLRARRFVVRAGPPSSNSLILAFVLPLSLFVGTVFTAIRIADKLEEKYLEEVAMNEAIMEEELTADEEYVDGDDDDDEDDYDEDSEEELAGSLVTKANEREDTFIKAEEQVVASTSSSRDRNRPRRQE